MLRMKHYVLLAVAVLMITTGVACGSVQQTTTSVNQNSLLAQANPANAAITATDVKAFGAVGDGVTDDSAAIQRAINSAACIRFSPGTYKVNQPLTLRSNRTILGNGAVIAMDSQAKATHVFYVRNISNVTIEDLNIIGGPLDKLGAYGNASNNYIYAIQFEAAHDITLKNVYGKCLDYFLKLDQDVYNVNVTNARCELVVMPIYIGRHSHDITITDCNFNQPDKNNYTIDHRNHPFYILNAHDITLQNIHVSGGQGFAIHVDSSGYSAYADKLTYNLKVSNMVIEDSWGEPIWLNSAENVVIDGLIFNNKLNSGRQVPHITINNSKNITLSNAQFSGGNWTTNGAPIVSVNTTEGVIFKDVFLNGESINF